MAIKESEQAIMSRHSQWAPEESVVAAALKVDAAHRDLALAETTELARQVAAYLTIEDQDLSAGEDMVSNDAWLDARIALRRATTRVLAISAAAKTKRASSQNS